MNGQMSDSDMSDSSESIEVELEDEEYTREDFERDLYADFPLGRTEIDIDKLDALKDQCNFVKKQLENRRDNLDKLESSPLFQRSHSESSRTTIISVIIMFIVCAGFNIYSICVGSYYLNHDCYSTKLFLSLGLWILIVSVIGLIINISMLFDFFITRPMHGISRRNIFLFMKPLIVTQAIFCLIVGIIGAIELAYQFNSCRYEISYATTTAISMVILCFVTAFGTFPALILIRK
jgi:hypothetical protein